MIIENKTFAVMAFLDEDWYYVQENNMMGFGAPKLFTKAEALVEKSRWGEAVLQDMSK